MPHGYFTVYPFANILVATFPLSMAKAVLLNFSVFPYSIKHKQNYPKSQNAFNVTRQHPKSTLLSSELKSIPVTNANYLSTDWNRKIYELCEVNNLKQAMELLKMSKSFKLDSITYCSVLQLCAEFKSLNDGKEVHSIICSNGILVDSILGSKLVFMYVTCGELREGRSVFDEIANEKVFLWNLMINGYAQVGDFKEAVFLFNKMLCLGIEVNEHTFSCVLKCLAGLGSTRRGEWVHGLLLKLGFCSCTTVVNSLMTFYFKSRRVDNACKLFDELIERDVISWNSMISGCVSNGVSEKGLEVFEEMACFGADMDLATMTHVLRACANCGNVSLGKAVQALAIKSRFDNRTTFGNTLLDMYSKCGCLDSAIRVFETIGGKSVISWTSMIAAYAREGHSDTAIRLFHEMEREGVRPDNLTITTILHACACNESLADGRDVHNYIIKNDMQSDLHVCNALMDMYAKCGSMEDANSVFQEMSVKDIISWNTMIGGYSRNGLPDDAFDLFAAMVQETKPDARTMACILPACASLAAVNKGREIHAYILRAGSLTDQHVSNALIDMYIKCGALVLAKLLFDIIPTKDLVSWTVMIAGYAMHGFGNEAIGLFNEMMEAGFVLNEVSFISILNACCHSGLLNEGWKLFNIMQDECNIEPKLQHYACLVELLARAGKLSMAYNFIKQMPIEPDAAIWESLLSGCRIYRDVKLAEKVAEHVFELEPESTKYYILLANIYAEAEKWKEVARLRQKSRRGPKNSACSWIEVKGNVELFVAGDSLHPEAGKIESVLKSLKSKMKKEGFSSNMRYALRSAGTNEKDMARCGHSEILAMAYGILSLPPGKTVQVTKNQIVCSDCHEMAKFMSKTFRREIVLRDSKRFHHFRNGTCSCRGFC